MTALHLAPRTSNTRSTRIAGILRLYICGALLVAPLLLTQGCKKKSEDKVASQSDPAMIEVTPALAANLKLGTAKMHDVTGLLRVSAHIETDASRIARVGSPVSGRILRLVVFEGQSVRPGTVLATLHSTDLSDAQLALIKAYSQRDLAEAATKRAEQLVAADVIGRAELERRQAELLQASSVASSYRTQLRGLGMSDGQIQKLITSRELSADYSIVTPKGGTVLERKVTIGQVVQPADPAFTIADLSSVWIVANVPEEDAGLLRKGMQVLVQIPALPNQKIVGHLSYVAPIVDPATRTVQVRMDIANPEGLYRPDELANMTFTGRVEQKLTIPQTAVVRQDNKDYIFIQVGPNKFLLREVTLGDEVEDRRVVQSGVTEDQPIVLDGAFHLNNQRKQNSIKGGK
ncbi:MAG: efflux transporter, family, subunit [Acidobacteriaceae bacterium]|nr:efflux transporter, family, subunit [Acidobacteriaceae bacterium]